MENELKTLFDIIVDYDNCEPVQTAISEDKLKEWAHILKSDPSRLEEVPSKVRDLNDMVIYLNNNKDSAKDMDIDVAKLLCGTYADAVPENKEDLNAVNIYRSLFDEIIRLPGLEAFALIYANRFALSLPISEELKSAMAEFDSYGVLSEKEAELVDDKYLSEIFKSKEK